MNNPSRKELYTVLDEAYFNGVTTDKSGYRELLSDLFDLIDFEDKAEQVQKLIAEYSELNDEENV